MSVRPNAVVLSTTGADNTGAGGPLGVYGNSAALKEAGYQVVNLVVGEARSLVQKDIPVEHFDPSLSLREIQDQLRARLAALKPGVVWLHHYWVWRYFMTMAADFPFVVLSGDPDPDLIKLHQRSKKYGNRIIQNLKHYYRYRTNLLGAARLERRLFAEMNNAGGVLACWCPSSITELELRVKQEVLPCPLAFPDWGERTRINGQNLLLLGNLNGAHTRIGLKYFLEEVWTHWPTSQGAALGVKIRMVGGGKIPDNYQIPEDNQYFEKVGFVENLEVEWENSLALLVTVPVSLGFRTRIVESWSKGVPVIAHPSAETSLANMKDHFNYLSATTAGEVAAAAQELKNDQNFYNEIIKNARETFNKYYSTKAAAGTYDMISQKAITKFNDGKNNSGDRSNP